MGGDKCPIIFLKLLQVITKNVLRKHGFSPLKTRTDCGTENGIIAAMQCFFQSEDNAPYSGESAHVFGTSTSNQRVQNWWIPNHLNYIHHRIFAEE